MTLQDVKCFLLDMDGTFYLGNNLIEGSLDFIEKVRATGPDFLFLTNNSSHNANFYVKRLDGMGLDVPREKILTSGEATADKLNQLYPGKRAFVLGNEYLIEEFTQMGVTVNEENPEIVVIGYDTTLDYKKMTRVCDLVRAVFPISPPTRISIAPRKPALPRDIGAIMAFIEASAFRRPELIVGKPNTGIVEAALRRTGLKTGEMVGDRLYTDIETGLRSGMLSILVMSGETTEEMLAKSETVPDLKFGSLADMIPLL